MGKSKNPRSRSAAQVPPPVKPDAALSTTSELRAHAVLGYKLRVLLYDLRNLAKDPLSEQRTLQSVDELYIGPPYMTVKESAAVKAATVSGDALQYKFDDDEIPNHYDDEADHSTNSHVEGDCTVEQAIHDHLQHFFEKRRASGDARPCRPHDMAPIYMRVFGVDPAELQDESFLARLWRNGPGESPPPTRSPSEKGKGRRKGLGKGI